MSLSARTEPPDPTSTEPAKCSPLLKLPNELLLSVTQRLCDNSDLCQLSLVCRRLKDVAQETLLKEVVLPAYSTRELVRTLCDRPDLCGKINSVDLDDYACSGRPKHGFRPTEWSYFRKCREIIGKEVFNKVVDRKDGVQLPCPKEHPFFLDVLIAACPNIKELIIRLPGIEQDPVQIILGIENGSALNPFFGVSRDLLEKRLRTLTIRESRGYMLLKTPNVTLSGYSHLTFLSIPTDALIFMSRIPTAVAQALPTSLHHLQIKPCNRFIVLWFPELAAAYFNGLLPKLCQIDLHFQDCLKDSLLLIDQGRGRLRPLRDVIGMLKHDYGASLRGYNGSGEFTGYLLEELEAWSLLSNTELWYPSGTDTEFSSMVARTAEGAPRSRSKEEIRTYIKRDIIFRFKPDVYLQVNAPLSFPTGAKELPKVVKPSFTSEFARWLASVAATQRKSESALREAPAQSSLESPIEEDPAATAAAMIFQGLVGSCPYVPFDPNQWLDLQFFEDLRSQRRKALVPSKGKNNQKRKHTVTSVVRGGSNARRVKARLSG
ncbi:uncharacterized protein N0V89_004590 [Didymosphaeria variabile]|uniref:F-box domain-containing protein n=1 Tax=Didymosphaeria variabile TaxID=1932322 RepID=A0A9W8XS36_9PLEO|nr:uncharacterized protein N0V89_004590 [Didymosphaeria variabile]KAJ4356556.1 hypothetical protein N0V89_004590 [Didymosphaeria variabile]